MKHIVLLFKHESLGHAHLCDRHEVCLTLKLSWRALAPSCFDASLSLFISESLRYAHLNNLFGVNTKSCPMLKPTQRA